LLSGALLNRLIERVPDNDRPAHMALHNLALNLGILIGSFSGPLLVVVLDLRIALLLAGGLRLIAAVLFWLWG
jgi:predicted MFS family arabinose efflux permease